MDEAERNTLRVGRRGLFIPLALIRQLVAGATEAKEDLASYKPGSKVFLAIMESTAIGAVIALRSDRRQPYVPAKAVGKKKRGKR